MPARRLHHPCVASWVAKEVPLHPPRGGVNLKRMPVDAGPYNRVDLRSRRAVDAADREVSLLGGVSGCV